MVDLAIGVVIGAAFGTIVQTLVRGVITPLVGAFGGVPDFSTSAVPVGASRLLIGELINAVLSLLLVALVQYFLVVLPVNHLMERYRPAPEPEPAKECPERTSKIPRAARRPFPLTSAGV